MAAADVTVTQDNGQGNVKLHPYLVTLVRWCVSCLWSTATVLLHRLMTTPLVPIAGPKPQLAPKAKIPSRAAGTAHLHPEPKVECQVLHQPQHHALDVIFVHGLYGSLGNTWRQGDWRQKYTSNPKKVPLRNHSTQNSCNCHEYTYNSLIHNENKCNDTNITDLNDPDMSMKKINEKLAKKVIPQENDLITEQFYNNTLLDQVETVDNYETQAKFVSDLFKKENESCDKECDENNMSNCYKNENNETNDEYKCDYNESDNDFKCNYNEINEYNECICKNEKKCEIGCGCICNNCYSTCWPKDWIKMDFPEARVISINYTSDPYLWRPLWIKENKRLNLYQRAEQMIEQLLDLGVGEKPIIWVGHSKGGLFIKQIYCEAYQAYLKINKNPQTDQVKDTVFEKTNEQPKEMQNNGITAANIDTIIGHFTNSTDETHNSQLNYNKSRNCDDNYTKNSYNYTKNNDNYTDNEYNYTEKDYNYICNSDNYSNSGDNYTKNNDNYENNTDNYRNNCDIYSKNTINISMNNTCIMNETIKYNNVFEQVNVGKNESANNDSLEYVNVINNDNKCKLTDLNENEKYEKTSKENGCSVKTSSIEDTTSMSRRASLWLWSRGFMFYSVPHRGSPLADIKTPVTARSVDLLEIAKDCPLVLELQERWLHATSSRGAARVSVRSFVETCRTLMSVLWLRIVSTDSADAGIGTLSGVSVDHREICKPSSRSCLLYTELVDLIRDALKCKCH